MRENLTLHLVKRKVGPALLLFTLFFLISFGLGYPTLNRYDPRQNHGISDAKQYYNIVSNEASGPRVFRYRVLVPYLAKPFYWLGKGRLGTWEPALFGLLVANSLLTAGTALLILKTGCQVVASKTVALLGATLYLLNFAVPNLRLAALVDSGMDFFLMAMVLTLISGRWFLLPLWCALGVLAKETFLPLATVFGLIWWLTEGYSRKFQFSRLAWLMVMAITGLAVLLILQTLLSGQLVRPWELTVSELSDAGFWHNLARCSILSHMFWQVFIWLLPLGVWRLSSLTMPWVNASLASAAVALVLGALAGVQDGAARVIFVTLGPIMSLSTAILLAELVKNWTDAEHGRA